MFKSKKSFISIRLIVAIVIIVIIIVLGINYVLGLFHEEQIKDFQSDILLVQSKVELLKGNYDMDKDAHPLKGIQLSQLPEDINIGDFLEKNIIAQEDYEKFYVLNNDSLDECGLGELVNKYEGNFIVNYDNYEVVYSKGYIYENGLWCFKISEMNKVEMPINQKVIETSANPEKEMSDEQKNEQNNEQTSEENNKDNTEKSETNEQSEVQEKQDESENNDDKQSKNDNYQKVKDEFLNSITVIKQNICNDSEKNGEEVAVE